MMQLLCLPRLVLHHDYHRCPHQAKQVTAPTWKPCPEKVCRHSPVLGAQTLTVASSDPETTALPEVVNVTQDTLLSCPANTFVPILSFVAGILFGVVQYRKPPMEHLVKQMIRVVATDGKHLIEISKYFLVVRSMRCDAMRCDAMRCVIGPWTE